ncbi:cbb3-type cytochrome oxidase subunit 3 [Marinicella sediminis]|uniref:Cbb3-type cytochrome oxidase subunit 3 n=1 Tax=Marinicella sediminis TaxID=1792834 RepID=A0ABV7JCT9_9GAMM|nr:cbb3-type cytochrome c oxidase subunit 3 [Marinicella sediminis]
MISGLYTGLLLVVFLGIIAWAWSKQNKAKFDELSRTALKEDEQIKAETEEKNHE